MSKFGKFNYTKIMKNNSMISLYYSFVTNFNVVFIVFILKVN